MKPGDRKLRWRQSHLESGIVFVLLGVICLVGISGVVGWISALFMFALGAWEFYDIKRGWPMKDGPSPWVRKMMERDKRS